MGVHTSVEIILADLIRLGKGASEKLCLPLAALTEMGEMQVHYGTRKGTQSVEVSVGTFYVVTRAHLFCLLASCQQATAECEQGSGPGPRQSLLHFSGLSPERSRRLRSAVCKTDGLIYAKQVHQDVI